MCVYACFSIPDAFGVVKERNSEPTSTVIYAVLCAYIDNHTVCDIVALRYYSVKRLQTRFTLSIIMYRHSLDCSPSAFEISRRFHPIAHQKPQHDDHIRNSLSQIGNSSRPDWLHPRNSKQPQRVCSVTAHSGSGRATDAVPSPPSIFSLKAAMATAAAPEINVTPTVEFRGETTNVTGADGDVDDGEQINQYMVHGKLGEGAFGSVFRVTDSETGQLFVRFYIIFCDAFPFDRCICRP